MSRRRVFDPLFGRTTVERYRTMRNSVTAGGLQIWFV